MQTLFTPDQLNDPAITVANDILRTCVHCGFCTATCPTYVLLGDEADSPRGRIYMIKEMLESGKPASDQVVKHVDRCLTCLGCMTTCPASVDYVHLVDHARVHMEKTHTRPLPERLLRNILAVVVPSPLLFRMSLLGAWFAKPFSRLFPGRLSGLVAMAPARLEGPSPIDRPQVFPAEGERKKRVALMAGCAQQVLWPSINEATVRLLTRHGCEVVIAEGAGCCGALTHHMGKEKEAHASAKANIEAWERAGANGPLDAVVINASGCGTTVKDYGFMLRTDGEWAERARKISDMTVDLSEFLTEIGLLEATLEGERPSVAYHSACSLQHGQQVTKEPKALLEKAGFEVRQPGENHICCGSAGSYNLLQPDIAGQLLERKVKNLGKTRADVVAAGNIGCMVHIAKGLTGPDAPPVVHTVELLDWATGGPKPNGLA